MAKKLSAKDLSPAKKKKIWKRFYNGGISIQKIADEEGVTFWTAYRIINGQTKLDGSPRADKGKKRKGKSATEKPKWSMDDFEDTDDFLFFMTMNALEQAATEPLSASEKVQIVKQLNDIQTKIQKRQLEGNIRRPDAEVIAILVRMFKPEATYKEVVKYYTKAHEQYLRTK